MKRQILGFEPDNKRIKLSDQTFPIDTFKIIASYSNDWGLFVTLMQVSKDTKRILEEFISEIKYESILPRNVLFVDAFAGHHEFIACIDRNGMIDCFNLTLNNLSFIEVSSKLQELGPDSYLGTNSYRPKNKKGIIDFNYSELARKNIFLNYEALKDKYILKTVQVSPYGKYILTLEGELYFTTSGQDPILQDLQRPISVSRFVDIDSSNNVLCLLSNHLEVYSIEHDYDNEARMKRNFYKYDFSPVPNLLQPSAKDLPKKLAGTFVIMNSGRVYDLTTGYLVPNLSNVKTIYNALQPYPYYSEHRTHYAITADDNLYAWGKNDIGTFGANYKIAIQDIHVPIKNDALGKVEQACVTSNNLIIKHKTSVTKVSIFGRFTENNPIIPSAKRIRKTPQPLDNNHPITQLLDKADNDTSQSSLMSHRKFLFINQMRAKYQSSSSETYVMHQLS